jgi:hypothetical protein
MLAHAQQDAEMSTSDPDSSSACSTHLQKANSILFALPQQLFEITHSKLKARKLAATFHLNDSLLGLCQVTA